MHTFWILAKTCQDTFMTCPPNQQNGVMEGAWWCAAVPLAMQSCWDENLHHETGSRRIFLPGAYSELAESSGQSILLDFSFCPYFFLGGGLCNASYADMRQTYFLDKLAKLIADSSYSEANWVGQFQRLPNGRANLVLSQNIYSKEIL